MNDAHAAPAGPRQELLYDPSIPTPSHAELARTLAEVVPTATLSTLALKPAGYPYGSFITYAVDAGYPIFLISELAEHTKNLRGDPRASLLIAEPGEGDPLARARVTLLGPMRPLGPSPELESAKQAYLARHPGSAYYADFKDFAFWRLEVEGVRYIGGYGRMSWVESEAWSKAGPDPIAPFSEGILEHMNADHKSTMLDYVKAFSRATDATEAELVSVDRYGFEMSVLTGEGPRPVRVAFSRSVADADQVRQEMVALAKQARAKVQR